MLQQFKSIKDQTDYLGTLLAELRKYARHPTKELKSLVLRLMQVELPPWIHSRVLPRCGAAVPYGDDIRVDKIL